MLADSARALEVAFESGDLGEIGARIKALGDEGCHGCHKKFRQKKRMTGLSVQLEYSDDDNCSISAMNVTFHADVIMSECTLHSEEFA